MSSKRIRKFNGCPDTDEDGVADPDECVDVAGPVENNGCPWPDQDNDGIQIKTMLAQKRLEKQAGCPEVTKEVLEALNAAGINIFFPADGFKLMGKYWLL